MHTRFMGLLVAGLLGFSGVAHAQTCGGIYTVQRGDALSWIADKMYKDAGKWTAIHSNNIADIGPDPNAIRAGQRLRLTCIDGLPTGLEGGTEVAALAAAQPIDTSTDAPASPQNTQTTAVTAAVAAPSRAIRLLTGDDFAPFTDRDLPNGGMLADVVTAAMDKSGAGSGFNTYWVNDWTPHLEPLLTEAIFDMGYPWFRPPCEIEPDAFRCVNFHFSEPLFEALMLLFVNKNNPIAFNSDSEMHGKTVCRPAGYSTHIFEQDGRNWLSDGHITLETPIQVSDCFDLLAENKVDAVVLNEFTGRASIKAQDLKDQIVAVDTRPVSIETLHVLIAKQHPQADQLLATVNAGLNKIREEGDYQRLLDTHMTRVWSEF